MADKTSQNTECRARASLATQKRRTAKRKRLHRKLTYSLVWILLRLVVAVLLIVLPGPALGLAVVTPIVVRLWTVLLVALVGAARPLLLL